MKKICSILMATSMLANLNAFANPIAGEEIYSGNNVGDTAAIYAVGSETDETEYDMIVESVDNKDITTLTDVNLYTGELNVISFKIGTLKSEKLNWGGASGLIFRNPVTESNYENQYIFDFGWEGARRRIQAEFGDIKDGEIDGKEQILSGYASGKMHNVVLKITKQYRDGEYFYDVIYIVDGKENKKSFPTSADGKMNIGFKAVRNNVVYVDDFTVETYTISKTKVNVADRSDVSVVPEIELSFTDEIDAQTLNNVFVESILTSDAAAERTAIDSVVHIDGNKYRLVLSAPLKKNTQYALDMSLVRDTNGNPTDVSMVVFTTRDSNITLEDSHVINNSLDSSEDVLLAFGDYVYPVQIYPGEKLLVANREFLVLAEDYRPIAAQDYTPNTMTKNEEFGAEFDIPTQKVKISGKTEMGFENELVAIALRDADGELAYTSMLKTCEGGYFSMEYTPVVASGVYTVTAKTLHEDFETTVKIRTTENVDDIIDIVNTKDADLIESGLISYNDTLLIDLDLYNNLTDKSFIAEELAKAEDYTNIEKLVYDIEVLSVIKAAIDAEDEYEVFSDYEDYVLSQDDEAYEIWDELSDTYKKSVLVGVINNRVYTPDKFKKELYLQSIFKTIEVTNKYMDVKNIIEEYHELLELDLDRYDRLGKPTSVAKGLCGKSWDVESFKDKFGKLVNAAANPTANPGAGGSNSPGGGGGGGSSVVSGNIPSPQTTPKPMNTPSPEAEGFRDMSSAAWAEEAVYALCDRKILNGYEDGTFRPNGNITREEFVTIIVRYLGLDSSEKCSFSDVSESDWFYESVAQAAAKGFINGISETEFGTGRTITRQDAAVILHNIGDFVSSGEVSFADKDMIAEYAVDAVSALYENGIINGNPDGNFDPAGALTRAQAAKMLYTYDLKKEDNR